MTTIMFASLSRRTISLSVLCAITLLVWSRNVLHHGELSTHDLLDAIFRSQLQHGIPLQLETNPQVSDDDTLSSPLYTYDSDLPIVNPYIKHILSCGFSHNEQTHHIRLPHTPFLNISVRTIGQEADPSTRYFNPTLIPLPSWSPYPYLLVSRLATAGFHQESHICLASLCLPKTSHKRLPLDVKACTDTQLDMLGPAGGLYCETPAQKLNIPTTPTWRCETSWSMYPDIPGFHDPRVFWSGKGEPLAIVNSGSQYGCVGLWVVDLRTIYKELDDVIKKGGGKLTQSKMSYPYITEITRNGQRDLIEKNWVLFFPKGEEAWVMYDMFKHGQKKQGHRGGGQVANGEQEGGQIVQTESVREEQLRTTGNERFEVLVPGSSIEPETHADLNVSSILANDFVLDSNISTIGAISTHLPTNLSDPTVTSNTANDSTESNQAPPKRSESVNPTPFDEFRYQKPQIHPSRSLAKLIGNGYTTTNLTSPFESPCFNTTHIHDVLGNIGHWHQGTNSLRLVLCRRPTAASTPEQKTDECTLTDANEEELVRDGRVVHVMILHRKFSNEMKLPMMYERYFMVWEARFPFRVVGINRFPILFEDEMAKPWSVEENFPVEDQPDDEEEREKLKVQRDRWRDVYFTYTPSLAWAWRGPAGQDAVLGERGLGTGYLGDEVVVGIGVDDVAQVVVREKIERLLSCLRLCPDFEI